MPSRDGENSSMDQVRELLMGTHIKEMETRLNRQEKTLLQEIANLRDSMQKRTDSLENFMKNEFSSFLRRLQEEKEERSSLLKNEQRERTEAFTAEQKERTRLLKEEKNEREQALERQSNDMVAKGKEIERKFTAISASLDAAEKGLRELMLEEHTRLNQTIEERYKEIMERIANTAAQIRHDVVSRAALSSMFAESAVRFSEHETANALEQKEQPSEQAQGNSES